MFKRILNFQVSNITSDKPVIRALAMPSTSSIPMRNLEKIAEIVSQQFSFISQRNRLPGMLREFLRNAGVTGDGCIHCYFDPTIENGQDVKGEIVCEVIDNLRVMFGNPNCRDVQKQPYIIISRRELVEDVRWRAENMKEAGLCNIDDVDSIKPDSEKFQNKYDAYTDDKVTVLTYYFRNRETKTIWCMESTESGLIREAYDTEYTLYPLVWLNWDYIRDCYHGQAKGIRQCLLVMGESSEDGVLVDSSGYGYARYHRRQELSIDFPFLIHTNLHRKPVQAENRWEAAAPSGKAGHVRAISLP